MNGTWHGIGIDLGARQELDLGNKQEWRWMALAFR
jgi:hypothetical protein